MPESDLKKDMSHTHTHSYCVYRIVVCVSFCGCIVVSGPVPLRSALQTTTM